MYIPKHFLFENLKVIYDLIKDIRFGILVSSDHGLPIATHLPIDLVEHPEGTYLYGHIAKANIQSKTMVNGNRFLVIFSTQDSYISPAWYNHLNVPTSNYISIHIYGEVSIINNTEELIEMLDRTTQTRESRNQTGYKVHDLPGDFLLKQLNGLVGFKLKIEDIQPNFKLSQNRNSEDFQNVVTKLQTRGNPNDIFIADQMCQLRKPQELHLRELNSKLIFKLAETDEEKLGIYDSRYFICKDLYPFLFTSDIHGHIAKDSFDDLSYLFYCKDDSVVGSCRITPNINGKWEISDSLPQEIELEFDPQKTLQLNRVYIDENYRNRAIHEFLFYYFSLWIIEHTQFSDYFAVCNAGLVRIYQKLGAKLKIEKGFHLIGRLQHKYYLVYGNIEEFHTKIKHHYSL